MQLPRKVPSGARSPCMPRPVPIGVPMLAHLVEIVDNPAGRNDDVLDARLERNPVLFLYARRAAYPAVFLRQPRDRAAAQ